MHSELQQFEYKNKRILQTKGELTQERKDLAETLHTAYKKLYEGTACLCDLLDEDIPELKTEG